MRAQGGHERMRAQGGHERGCVHMPSNRVSMCIYALESACMRHAALWHCGAAEERYAKRHVTCDKWRSALARLE